MDPDLKQKVHKECLLSCQRRIDLLKQSMNLQKEAAENDTKSSAGDKYETGRAMAHLEQEKLQRQIQEVTQQILIIRSIDPNSEFHDVRSGSLVLTDNGMFFIAVSLGLLEVDSQKVMSISPASPIGQLMLGQKSGR